MSDFFAVIMAGGVGSRFWPVSTPTYPKQFHDMLGTGASLLQKTFSRLSLLVPEDQIFILTHESYLEIVKNQLPTISENQILLEPEMKNTAPCILYAALKIHKLNPNAKILVAPSDHWIEDETAFVQDAKKAFDFCKEEHVLMTLGIKPTFPNTGFGYIEYEKNTNKEIKSVKQFREKPDYTTAKSFLNSGNFLWNAGIFLWSTHAILDAFKRFQPEMFALFSSGNIYYNTDQERNFILSNYTQSENISIDYAILEKSDRVFVLPVNFDWNDLGTWGSLYDKLEKDSNVNAVVNAKVISENSSNNMIYSDSNKNIVIRGLDQYIVVDTVHSLLIYPKDKEQEIKEVVKCAELKN